jgi:hypothetical protein
VPGTDDILLLDRVGDVGHGQPQLGQLVRFDPDPHRVVAAAQHAGLANALDTRDRVQDVDGQVITLEILVVAAVGRIQRYQHQRKGQFLFDRDAQPFDFLGDTGLRLGDTVLDQHIRHVEVRSHFE